MVTAERFSSTPPFGEAGLARSRGQCHPGPRDYDVVQARFLSQDPLGFDGGDFNLFRYVGNNPVNVTDPSGLSCTGLCFEIKKSQLLSCTASNITVTGCGFKGNFVTASKLCAGIKDSVTGKGGLKIDTCAGTTVVCGQNTPCSCQDKKDKKRQTIQRTYKGIKIELVKEIGKGCFVTFDLKVKIKVGEGWEGTCK
jgi:RHS repeat-associated protein